MSTNYAAISGFAGGSEGACWGPEGHPSGWASKLEQEIASRCCIPCDLSTSPDAAQHNAFIKSLTRPIGNL
eukprot:623461-Pelagomonas_calceolata.AAC.1